MMLSHSVNIRELEFSELDALIDLYKFLHESDDPMPSRETIEEVWAEMLASSYHYCFGVFENHQLVSSCTMTLTPNLTRACRPYGVIENVVTHGSHRNKGLGKAILKYALDLAWSKGCYKVMLLTGSKKESTLQFYEKAGFDRHVKQGFIARPLPNVA